MPRKASVILTPSEKKAAVASAKDAYKDAKAALAAATKSRKQLDADYTKACKASDKALKAAEKAVLDAETKLHALQPPKAVPTPVEPAQ